MQLENGKTYQIRFFEDSMHWNFMILEHCGGDWYKAGRYKPSDSAGKAEVKKDIDFSKAKPTYVNIAQACTINIFDDPRLVD